MLIHILAACLVTVICFAMIGTGILCYRLFHQLKTDFGYGKESKQRPVKGTEDIVPVDPYEGIINDYPTYNRQDGVKDMAYKCER